MVIMRRGCLTEEPVSYLAEGSHDELLAGSNRYL